MKTSLSLILAAVFALSIAFAADSNSKRPGFKNVSVEQFDKLRADPKNVVLDVRTKKEYDGGHIPGAVLIDWNSPDFEKEVAKLDKSKTYLVHCAGGVRSVKACNLMGKLQFTNCYNLEPGFRDWEKAGKAVEK